MANEKKDMKIKTCGIVMPISEIDGCSEAHWNDVKDILYEAIETGTKFTPSMVYESENTAIIQTNIVQNLYENEIVICDISGKNPNVMFELGLRLAFESL